MGHKQMRRSILAALLVLSLALAGCNSIVSSGEETPERTVTPAPVPTDRPTPTPVPQLAPGLTGKGVTDAFALAEAHAAVLDNASYTRHITVRIQYANGTIFRQATGRSQYAANDSRFYTITRFYTLQNRSDMNRDGVNSLSRWSNGERVIKTRTRNNTTSYNIPRNGDGEPIPPRELSFGTRKERIALLFSTIETRVTNQMTRNGTTLYRVEATNVTGQAAFEGVWQNPRNVTFRALISSQGIVREYRLHYMATLNNSTVRVHQHVRYTDIGNTTVERPPWYDEAIKNVSTATPSR
jgi:hypothetical protein